MTLSIITINLNNYEGLQKTIDSILSQTWAGYEWIVIDGGSTDGSRELLEQYQEHFAYWCSEPDKGVYNAMNKGVAKAKGEYLNFMNSGDTFYEAETLRQVFCKERTADILYGNWVLKRGDKEIQHGLTECELQETLWQRNLCHQAMFFHSDLLKHRNYDESMKILADWKWNTEKLLAGTQFVHLDIIICKYAADGISSHWDNTYYEELDQVLSLYPPYMQLVVKELEFYCKSVHIQMLKEILEGNCLIASLMKLSTRVHFYAMLVCKRISNLFRHDTYR